MSSSKYSPLKCHVQCHEPEQYWQCVSCGAGGSLQGKSHLTPEGPQGCRVREGGAGLTPHPSCGGSEVGKLLRPGPACVPLRCRSWGSAGAVSLPPCMPVSPCVTLCAELGCCWCSLRAQPWPDGALSGSWGRTPKLGAPAATAVFTFDCSPLLPNFSRVIILLSMKSWAHCSHGQRAGRGSPPGFL